MDLKENVHQQAPLTQHQQKWDDPSILDYSTRIEPPLDGFNQIQSSMLSNNQIRGAVNELLQASSVQDWDPSAMLNNLSFLEQKIHQLQDLVRIIVGRKGQVLGRPDELVAQQQQLVTADLTSIIVQLISTAGSLLPSGKEALSAVTLLPSGKEALSAGTPSLGQFAGVVFPSVQGLNDGVHLQNAGRSIVLELPKSVDICFKNGNEQSHITEEHVSKDEEDLEEGENLLPGTYEILQLEKEEILAPHTHFCTICGKGFKRDANLRMHMRGHGNEYKTPGALAKPNKESCSEPAIIKRYSCPYAGCKRNKDHKKFQPLKTILCVKNHYKRTHCDKSYICSRCNTKKFSVIADLKTHEKHCGKDKWLCSCGTTFSRKDKLFGHIALFQGHTPAIPSEEAKAPSGPSDQVGDGNQSANNIRLMNFNFSSNVSSESEVQSCKGSIGDPAGYFSPFNFDTCNFDGFHEFPRLPLDDSESSFAFLLSGSSQKSED